MQNYYPEIISISREFHRGYELCFGNGMPAKSGELNALIPAIVCLSFSIELALKANIYSKNPGLREHKLNELFNLLSNEDQESVINELPMSRKEFEKYLLKASNTFTEWRYLHERPGIHTPEIQFLIDFYQSIELITHQKESALRKKLQDQHG